RGLVVALQREGASSVVERDSRTHGALGRFAERIGGAVVLAGAQELLADGVPGIRARGRIAAHLLETGDGLARSRLACRALLPRAPDEVAEARVAAQGDEIVVVHEISREVEPDRRGLFQEAHRAVAIAETRVAAG